MIEKSNSKTPEIKVLKTELIDKLLSKKTIIGIGSTSKTYKVNNCFSNKGNLCLKVLNLSLFYALSEKTKTMNEWPGEEEEVEDEIPEIYMGKIRQLYNENEILNGLDHPNIIKVYGFYFGDKTHSPAILLEYCVFNLEKAVKLLTNIDLVGIIYEICSAMNYIHDHKIIHRDLKMSNILVNIQKHVKICDFGISREVRISTLSSITHNVGTFAFMAPEMFKEDEKYDEKVDIYSFAVVMYFVLTKGQMPKFTGTGGYETLTLPNTINQLSQSIIEKCWSNSPTNRPSFDIIIKKIVKNNFMLIDGIEGEIPKLKEHLGLK